MGKGEVLESLKKVPGSRERLIASGCSQESSMGRMENKPLDLTTGSKMAPQESWWSGGDESLSRVTHEMEGGPEDSD